MAKIMIANYDYKSLVDSWLKAECDGVQFPVPFDIAWKIAGYSRKDSAKRKLPKRLQDIHFHISVEMVKRKQGGGRNIEKISLSCDGFKHICLMAETEQGDYIRNYFIEAEKKWRLVQEQYPQVTEDIERQRLLDQERILNKQIELMKLTNSSKQLDSTMLTLHGKDVVLALRGCTDQIVEIEKKELEVIDKRCNYTHKGMTSKQFNDYLGQKLGWKFKSGSQAKKALQEVAPELLSIVQRPVNQDFISTEKVEDAVKAIAASHNHQYLLGE